MEYFIPLHLTVAHQREVLTEDDSRIANTKGAHKLKPRPRNNTKNEQKN